MTGHDEHPLGPTEPWQPSRATQLGLLGGVLLWVAALGLEPQERYGPGATVHAVLYSVGMAVTWYGILWIPLLGYLGALAFATGCIVGLAYSVMEFAAHGYLGLVTAAIAFALGTASTLMALDTLHPRPELDSTDSDGNPPPPP